jgi:hypothetical protein
MRCPRPFTIVCVTLLALAATGFAHAQTPPEPFGDFIRQAVEKISADRPKKGYNINRAFTQNLKYGKDCCIKATNPPDTMCVAAVSEVIVEALNIYHGQNAADGAPFKSLPMKSWTGGTRKDIRAHIFMFDGMGSKGTASALRRFGIGEELKFEQLKPYDFINFDRTGGSGHAAIFLGYIDKQGEIVDAFDQDKVAGFKYFSAQGAGKPDAGFWYRWGFFDGACPSLSGDRTHDCTIVRRSVVAGRLWHPKSWQSDQTATNLARDLIVDKRSRARQAPLNEEQIKKQLRSRSGEIQRDLSRTLKEQIPSKFTGVTVD